MSVHSPARRRQNLPKDERKEQLLAAALKAFGRGGYHGTHVADVVAEAGVARGTFYLHFESKHEVFEALVDRMLAIFLAARPPNPEPRIKTLADAEAVLRMSYRTVLGTIHEHRHLARLLFEEAVGIAKGFQGKLEQHYREWHRRVAETRQHLVNLGLADPDLDVEVTAEMVLGMTERVARRYLFGAVKPDLDRLVEALVSWEMWGFSPRRR
jgi:AcrR family transcriptional regulator